MTRGLRAWRAWRAPLALGLMLCGLTALHRGLGVDGLGLDDAPRRVRAQSSAQVRARSLRFRAAALLGMTGADLNGDGRDELVIARAAHVSVYSLSETQGRLRIRRLARARWPSRRLRVPAARRAAVEFFWQGERLVAQRSDLDAQVALELRGEELLLTDFASECPGGVRFPDGCAAWVAGRDYFAADLQPFAAGAADTDAADTHTDTALAEPSRDEGAESDEPRDDEQDEADSEADSEPSALRHRFYVRRYLDVRQPDQSRLTYVALITPHGSLMVRAGEARAGARSQGAALSIADVDADGVLDILTSDYVRVGQADKLRWFRMTPSGRLSVFWESPELSGSVLVSAAGNFLGNGRLAFLAFEARERAASRLWVVQ